MGVVKGVLGAAMVLACCPAAAQDRSATLVRMVLPEHTCPFGVRAKALLEQHGFTIEERILGSRPEVDAFKAEQGVSTTPQIFIDGDRVGGSDDLEAFLSRG